MRTGWAIDRMSRDWGILDLCLDTEVAILPNTGLNAKDNLMTLIYHHIVACSSTDILNLQVSHIPSEILCLLYSKTELHPDTSLMLQLIIHSQGTKTLDVFIRQSFVCLDIILGFMRGKLSPCYEAASISILHRANVY